MVVPWGCVAWLLTLLSLLTHSQAFDSLDARQQQEEGNSVNHGQTDLLSVLGASSSKLKSSRLGSRRAARLGVGNMRSALGRSKLGAGASLARAKGASAVPAAPARRMPKLADESGPLLEN